MKKISILIPCYNEEENVGPISEAVVETLERDLPEYDYELVFIDNDSTDQTRPILRKICSENPRIKAIFNVKNFGQFNSPYYGMLQCTGDCVISMVADFQDPVDVIPLKKENVNFIKRAMQDVTQKGTGRAIFAGAPYTVGGKTGTAQVLGIKQGETYNKNKIKERHRDHSLFIAFAPVDKPKIALAIMVENGGFGAAAAAPLARKVLDYYLIEQNKNAGAYIASDPAAVMACRKCE